MYVENTDLLCSKSVTVGPCRVLVLKGWLQCLVTQMAVIFERLEYCLLLIMSESAWKKLSYSAGCCTNLQESIFYTFVHSCFLRLFAATKGFAWIFRQLQQILHVPLFTPVHWHLLGMHLDFPTGKRIIKRPIKQLTQFPLIRVPLNNHKWIMSCVSVYMCVCFICLCSRLVVAV